MTNLITILGIGGGIAIILFCLFWLVDQIVSRTFGDPF